MEIKYLNVIDVGLADNLISQGCRLLNSINSGGIKMWTFEYEPRLFCLDFEDKQVSKKCFLSDAFKMTF